MELQNEDLVALGADAGLAGFGAVAIVSPKPVQTVPGENPD
jgi:hypothetical protein